MTSLELSPGRFPGWQRSRLKRLRQELAIRGLVALVILGFHAVSRWVTGGALDLLVTSAALLAFCLNFPYYLLARTGRWLRPQAYVRMCVDIAFITVGLYSVGGLLAAPYLAVYLVVPVYAGTVFSSRACLVATCFATASYLAVALPQQAGWISTLPRVPAKTWEIAAFNLLLLNLVGVLTALLAEALRQSRRRLAALNEDLERANDQLLRLNAEIQRAARLRALSEVAAGVTHEIRNTVSIAFGHLAIARRMARDVAPDIGQELEEIRHSCDTVMRIVDNALQLARHPSAEKIPVSIAQVARRVVELKQYDLRRHRISVSLSFPPEFPRVSAAPVQLQQVLLNLITNAEDAIRGAAGQGAIEIAGIRDPERAVIEVRDSGPGIPPEVLLHLFEPFYTTKADGTGLGLKISSGIVGELGGELTAANRLEGGAVFRLSLPAFRECETAPREGALAHSETRSTSAPNKPYTQTVP